MKKIYILLFVLASIKVSAQCTPFSSNTPGIYPSALAPGCQNVAYTDTVTFVAPADTVLFGFTIPIDSIKVTGVTNLPTGLNYVCTPSNCTQYNPSNGNPLKLCMLINGTPTTITPPNDSITVTGTAWVTVPFVGVQSFSQSFKVAISISICTGINNSIANNFKLYPNPANTVLSIDFNAVNNAPAHFTLINAIGQVVMDKKLNDIENKIDLTSVADGVYMYQLETANGIYTDKLVIKK